MKFITPLLLLLASQCTNAQTATTAKYKFGTTLLNEVVAELHQTRKLNEAELVELVDDLTYLMLHYDPVIMRSDFTVEVHREQPIELPLPGVPANPAQDVAHSDYNPEEFKKEMLGRIYLQGFNKAFFEFCFNLLDKTLEFDAESKKNASYLNHLIGRVNPSVSALLQMSLQLGPYRDISVRKCGFQASLFMERANVRLAKRNEIFRRGVATPKFELYEDFFVEFLSDYGHPNSPAKEAYIRSPWFDQNNRYRSHSIECIIFDISQQPRRPGERLPYCSVCSTFEWFQSDAIKKAIESNFYDLSTEAKLFNFQNLNFQIDQPRHEFQEIFRVESHIMSNFAGPVVEKGSLPLSQLDNQHHGIYKIILINDFCFTRLDNSMKDLETFNAFSEEGAVVAFECDETYLQTTIYKIEPFATTCNECDEKRIAKLLGEKRVSKINEAIGSLENRNIEITQHVQRVSDSNELLIEQNEIVNEESGLQSNISNGARKNDVRNLFKPITDRLLESAKRQQDRYEWVSSYGTRYKNEMSGLISELNNNVEDLDDIVSALNIISNNLKPVDVTSVLNSVPDVLIASRSFNTVIYLDTFDDVLIIEQAPGLTKIVEEIVSMGQEFLKMFNRSNKIELNVNSLYKKLSETRAEIRDSYPVLDKLNEDMFIQYKSSNFELGIKFPENLKIRTKPLPLPALRLVPKEGDLTRGIPCTDGVTRPLMSKAWGQMYVNEFQKEFNRVHALNLKPSTLNNTFEPDISYLNRQFIEMNYNYCFDHRQRGWNEIHQKWADLEQQTIRLTKQYHSHVLSKLNERITTRMNLLNALNSYLITNPADIPGIIAHAQRLNDSQADYDYFVGKGADQNLTQTINAYQQLVTQTKVAYNKIAMMIYHRYTDASRNFVDQYYNYVKYRSTWKFDDGLIGYNGCVTSLKMMQNKWVELNLIKNQSKLTDADIGEIQKQLNALLATAEKAQRTFPAFVRINLGNRMTYRNVAETKLYLTPSLQNVLETVSLDMETISQPSGNPNKLTLTSLSYEKGGKLSFNNGAERHQLHTDGKCADFIPILITSPSIPTTDQEVQMNAELILKIVALDSVRRVYFKNRKVRIKFKELLRAIVDDGIRKKYAEKFQEMNNHETHLHIHLF